MESGKRKLVRSIFAIIALSAVPSAARADWGNERSCDTRPRYSSNNYFSPRPSYPRPSLANNYYSTAPHYNNHFTGYGLNDTALRNGIRSGQLSSNEVRELREDQREIAEKRSRYLADGRLSNRERDSLRDEIAEYRKDLNHELNDGERRQRQNYGYQWNSWR